jgi:nucleoside-diphosphate-sugar epimerase
MSTKKVLVTGANGCAGSNLCKKLISQGYQVRALVRPSSNLMFLNGKDVELVYGDLAISEPLPVEAFKGVETVYHIAAAFRIEGVPENYFYDVNVGGTQRVLDASLKADVGRFVHCSTIGVLGDITNPPANEMTSYKPNDIYQETKTEGEKLALAFHKEHKLPLTVVRPATIYGPTDLRLLKLFKTIDKGVFVMIGPGISSMHLIYIEDLTDGIILAGERDEAVGETFILAGNEPIRVKELVNMVAEVLDKSIPRINIPLAPVMLAAKLTHKIFVPLGIEPPIYPRRLDFFVKNREFDISKARSVLGFSPKVDLKTGLACTVDWYRQNNYL